jgi:tetratricopeptide (TPR) repeat protein
MNQEPAVYCERVLQDDVAVAYLRGELPEPEREAFERHCFECATCFERLQVVRDLQGVLRRDAAAAPRSVMPGATARRPAGWLAWAAGAAFVAVGAGMVLRNLAPGPVPVSPPATSSPAATAPGVSATDPGVVARPPLEVLARVEPPPYAPLVVRGGDPAEVAFAQAMERYVRGDYAGAASGLREALRTDSTDVEARFYLGVSDLLAGRPEPAIRELESVAGGDDEGFAEAARYYLAKAHLARRDVAAARRELQRLAGGDGDHKEPAKQLLKLLDAE